jgi:acyl carrier protein
VASRQRERIVAADERHNSNVVLRQEFPLLGAYVAPRTSTEHKLAQIYCTALSMDEVSVTDDFEELGGDSLLAVSICAEIEKIFAIAVPIATLLHSPTIEELAPKVDDLVSKRGS